MCVCVCACVVCASDADGLAWEVVIKEALVTQHFYCIAKAVIKDGPQADIKAGIKMNLDNIDLETNHPSVTPTRAPQNLDEF